MALQYINGHAVYDTVPAETYSHELRFFNQAVTGTVRTPGTAYTMTAVALEVPAQGHAAIGVATPDIFPVDVKAQSSSGAFKEIVGDRWQSGSMSFSGDQNQLNALIYTLTPDPLEVPYTPSPGTTIGASIAIQKPIKFLSFRGNLLTDSESKFGAGGFSYQGEIGHAKPPLTEFPVDPLAITVIGNGVSLTVSPQLNTDPLAIPFATPSVSLTRHITLGVNSGTMTYLPGNAQFSISEEILATPLDIDFFGLPASVIHSRILKASAEAIPLTTGTAALTKDKVIAVNPESLALLSESVALTKDYVLPSTAYAIPFTGVDSGLTKQYLVNAVPLSLALTEVDAVIQATRILGLSPLEIPLVTESAGLTLIRTLYADPLQIPFTVIGAAIKADLIGLANLANVDLVDVTPNYTLILQK